MLCLCEFQFGDVVEGVGVVLDVFHLDPQIPIVLLVFPGQLQSGLRRNYRGKMDKLALTVSFIQ